MGNWGHPLRPLRPHWPPHPPDLGCCMILGSSHTFIQALGTARLGNCSSSDPLPPRAAPAPPRPGVDHGSDALWPHQLDWAHAPRLGANVKANGSLPSVVAPHSLGRWAAALVRSLKAGISCPPQRGLSPFCTTIRQQGWIF